VGAMCGFHDNVQQHSGDWTMAGKVPVARRDRSRIPATIGRMDAIRNAETMKPEDSAGSLDADLAKVLASASCRLARFFGLHGFCLFGRRVVS